MTPRTNVCFLFFVFIVDRMVICHDAMLMRKYCVLNMLRSCYVLPKEFESICGNELYEFRRVSYYRIVEKLEGDKHNKLSRKKLSDPFVLVIESGECQSESLTCIMYFTPWLTFVLHANHDHVPLLIFLFFGWWCDNHSYDL